MSGPARTPSNIAKFRGNPGRRPLSDKEPKPPITAPPMPDYFDAVARETWAYYEPKLLAVGCLTESDLTVFERLCVYRSQWVRLAKKLTSRHALFEKTSQGRARKAELFALETAAKMIAGCEAKLGLSPSDRTRIEVDLDAEKPSDPAKKILGWS